MTRGDARRLAMRGAAWTALVVVEVIALRVVVEWDAGARLLGGAEAAKGALAILVLVGLRIAVYAVVPPIVVAGVVSAVLPSGR
jgi:hypothetical protein